MKKIILLLFLFIIIFEIRAQRVCGTMEYYKDQVAKNPNIEISMNALQNYTTNWINANHLNVKTDTGFITIPVVVHVVWHSANENISDHRIYEQMAVLNRDFSGQNPHGMGAHSSVLKVNTGIRFRLATIDQMGRPTNGIIRTFTDSLTFARMDHMKYAASSGDDAWDVNKYLNIWVCNLKGNLCGYAQLPYEHFIGQGVNSTFGLVIDYEYFGITGTTAPYNEGGTTSHEIGHCFNLAHIWGDDTTCNENDIFHGSDLCGDTPNQARETYGTHSGILTDSCTTTSPGIMYMNFMDYSDDGCLANFTPNQKERIQSCFANGGPLHSLSMSETADLQEIPNIIKLEYFIDADPGFGNATPVTISAENDITSSFNIPLDSASTGFHILYVRAKDENLRWSLCHSLPFYNLTINSPSPNISELEYFLDNDPGFGNGTALSLVASANIIKNFTIDLNNFSTGFHILYIRAKDNYGNWSLIQTQAFYNTTITNTDITNIEYFIDTDPGFGNGTSVNIIPSANITKNLNIPLTGLSDGFHVLYIRAKDSHNKWSLTQTQSFYKITPANKEICGLEYYFDSDPGFGNGVPVSIIPNSANPTTLFDVDLACLSTGEHVIYLRAKDTYNKWSLINVKSITVSASSPMITYSGSTSFCQGDSVILTAPSHQGTSYQWKLNETEILGANDSIYIAKTNGTYKVIMSHSAYNTCIDSTISVDVTVHNLPPAHISAVGSTQFCEGDSVLLITEVGSDLAYTWKYYETPIINETLHTYTAKYPGIYKVIVVDTVTGCSDSSNLIVVNVKPAPTVEAGEKISFVCTPVQVGSAMNGPGTISWLPQDGMNNPSLAQPLVSPSSTTIYTITVDYDGCVNTDTVTVIFDGGHSISGKTRYTGKANAGNLPPYIPSYNAAIYNIDNVIVVLKEQMSGNEIARDTSDADANFHFNCIAKGNYILSYDKYSSDTMQSGNGIDAIDVTLLKYYIGIDTLVDPSRCFSAKYKKAANVDNNTAISAIDISRIKAKIGSPYIPNKNFPKGHWVQLDTIITITDNDLNITLKTICYGDYNASSYKYRDSVINWSLVKSYPNNIINVDEDYITTSDASYFEIPLRINTKIKDYSALGLELYYPNAEYNLVSACIPGHVTKGLVKINPSLEEILTTNNDLLVTDENGVIRIVYTTTNHYDVNINDSLIILGFSANKGVQSGMLDFSLTGSGIVGDQYGNEVPDAYFSIPKILVSNDFYSAATLEFSCYPNPFSDKVSVRYNLPENGNVIIKILNTHGNLLSIPIKKSQCKGFHTEDISGMNLPAGLYALILEFEGSEKSSFGVVKLLKPMPK